MGQPAIEGVGGPSKLGGAERYAANLMLDMIEQAMQQSGLPQSDQTRSALQGLRDELNGNQKSAKGQVEPKGGEGPGGPKGPEGAEGPKGPGEAEGEEGKGLIDMLMKLLQMLMPLLQQLQQGKQGGANGTASEVANGLPGGSGSPLGGSGNSSMDSLGNLFTSYGEMFEGMNKQLKPMLGNAAWN
ncbi:hypothetical protein OOT46_20815 [Aquabacterium sp. A7-Y]|uniref:hypothetical protein n=1 Tax=Aquabacterium sp. A7-Y TaxID=1349605 RepID=UPI00223C9900|nr:hypothetical protein [Aquabacterium sp. A7-Y]MCW7540280.1 hypothetical protein [Aquabacterium sp. A7-Y]